MNVLIFGYGYVADYLVKHFMPNSQIYATTRSQAKLDTLNNNGVNTYIFDSNIDNIITTVDAILITIPPNSEGDPAFLAYQQQIAKSNNLKWLGYLSTTGVYGDHNGNWIDEETPVNPKSDNARHRVIAENQWLKLYKTSAKPTHIFRVAGIYGPGRSQLEKLKNNKLRCINKPGHVMNRIHVHDICQTLMASINSPSPGQIYNLADDLPTSSLELIDFLCSKLGVKPPKLESFDPQTLSTMALQFYCENKRVSNNKIKQDLAIKLQYPNYKLGYKSLIN